MINGVSRVCALIRAPLMLQRVSMHALLSLQKPQKPLVSGTENTVQPQYLQMELLYDARDQPGELVHINRIDESHRFFYAVWERGVVRVNDSGVLTTEGHFARLLHHQAGA